MTGPLNILEGLNDEILQHYDVGDGWVIVLTGDEITRPKTLIRVAMTRAEIVFSNENDYQKFMEVIRESESRMNQIPDSEVKYTWVIVRKKGLIVRFGVSWWDKKFYHERKDAYLSELHNRVFSKFNIKPDDLRIEHIPF